MSTVVTQELPEPGMVEGFVGSLRRLGLLEADDAALERPAAPRRHTRGGPLYLRFSAFDPDRLLDRLVDKVAFCFTPAFLVFSAAVIVLGFGIAVAEWGDITRDLRRLWRVEMLLVAWLITFMVSAAHEFAHGFTCKRFGGHVHEMGFLLIYFQPAFYCNVSDAWLIAEKSKRLWVTISGPYLEIFLWALAVIIWRVTEPGTWPSAVALVVVAASAFRLFINLNPLIKLDGYYLLSDTLGIHNLRARAEVVDPEGDAEQVVAVELDQGIEVDEEPEGRGGDHHQRDSAGPGARLRDPPNDDCQGPEENLQVRPGDGHPEALGLLRDEPGIAHVAVEGRLKVDEQEPHLMNVAPEPLASEAVRELVRRRDHES